MEDTDPSSHPRSEYLCPNGFLQVLLLQFEFQHPNGFPWALPLRSGCLHPIEPFRVLLLLRPLLSILLFPSEPHTSTYELGERLASPRRVWLLPAVLPVPPLFHPFGLGGRLGNTRHGKSSTVVPPFPGLLFLLCGPAVSVVLLARDRAHPGR